MQIIQADGAAPEGEVRQITDYVSATGTFTVTAFSTTVAAGDEVIILHESLVAIGRDDADNTFSSTNVVGNRDGSLLERTEFIISMITGGAADLRVSQSVAGTVEEGGFLQFTVGLMDIDTGAIASANIDITGITQTMERSRGGAAWSAMTAPSFSKADGQVYCSYEFLAAEWQTGDMYRLTLTGVECTIGTQTAYVPAMIWSNIVLEQQDLHTAVAAIQEDLGDFSAQTNLQSLLAVLGVPDVAAKPLYTTIITDRLDNATYGLSALETLIDDLETKLATGAGVVQIATTTEDLNQAASTYDLLTGTTQPVLLETLSFKMPTVDISGGALTYITIQTDDVTPQVVFNSTDGALANLTSEAELSWTGVIRVNVGTKLQLTIAGGAAGTACSATVTAGYKAITAGGTLA
jgi:hypothetical protein